MATLKNWLKDVTINKVSLVGKPANQRQFLLLKNAEGVRETMDKNGFIELLKATPADAAKILKEAGVPENLNEQVMKSLEPFKGIADTITDEAAAMIVKSIEGLKPTTPVVDVVSKEDYTALMVRVQKAEETASNSDKIAKEEKDLRIKQEFIAKAQKEFGYLPSAVPADFGPILKECSEKLSKETYEKLEGILKSTNAVIQKSELFKSHGSGSTATGSAWDQIVTIANGMLQKDASGKLTQEQAISKMMEMTEHQTLFAQYKEEQRVSNRQ